LGGKKVDSEPEGAAFMQRKNGKSLSGQRRIAMSKKSLILGVLFLLLCSAGGTFAADQTSSKTIPQKRKIQKLTPKVASFLQNFERASTFDEVLDLYGRANMTEAELGLIKEEITNSKYDGQIKKLTAKDSAFYRAQNMKISRDIKAGWQAELVKQKNVKLRSSNQTAQQRLSSIKAVLKHPEDGPNSSASSTDISSMLAPPVRPSGEKLARIDSISPRSVMVGQEFYITGEKFGRPSQGKVYLSVGRITYECSIRGWMENEIRAIVPQQLSRLVRESEKDGRLYIQPFGRQREATAAIRIRPNPRLLIPEIYTLSDNEIMGGQILIIEGKNFLDSRGTIEFKFGTRTFAGQVEEWTDRYIAVKLQLGITGLPQTPGYVSVANIHRESASHRIAFEPDLTVQGLQVGSTDLAFFSDVDIKYEDFNFELKNGWHVIDNYVQVASHRILPGSHYWVLMWEWAEGTHAKSVRWVVIGILGRVCSWNHLFIEGPAGVPYR
jgi:hypothetical protein